jgi:teichuronic acid biosynthesis glycosyltransferase TuaC
MDGMIERPAGVRVLAITNLFPNAIDPLWSPFNRQQFAALGRLCEVEVLGTIPWFPGATRFMKKSRAARMAAAPSHETIDGLEVEHPRVLYAPKLPGLSGALYAASLLPKVMRQRGRVDVILGAWAYPDGIGAILLGELLRVPVVVKVHGSDLNVVGPLPGPRRNLELLLPRAARVVAVSRPLADAAAAFGMPRERIDLVYNGVDGALFHPRDRAEARRRLGLPADGRLAVYVGRVELPKGVVDLLDAVPKLPPGIRVAFVGDGEARPECDRRRSDRVLVAGARPLDEVPLWIAASDCLVLPSWAEGTPNVILEALACGRRVVATHVGGIPDLVGSPAVGELVPPRRPDLLAAALARVAERDYDPATVATASVGGSWEDSAKRLLSVLERARENANR